MPSVEASASPRPVDAPASATARPSEKAGRGAFLVSAGILFSRIFGFVRLHVFAHFFGNSVAAAAFQAALRIPNFLQNLFGEGVLSASFIPVYAKLLGSGDEEEADRVAGAVFGLLSLVTGLFVLLGIFCAPWLVDIIAGGFGEESRELTTHLVRLLFPATGLLVYSAWCLGILNSHRRFFLSYAAPVLWNGAQIGALLLFGFKVRDLDRLAVILSWSVVVGSGLQFGVQVPRVRALIGKFRPSLDAGRKTVRQVLRGFGPVVVGRGVVQVSAYVDTFYASLVSEHAFSILAYAQMLYLLPISLFGMSVAAAELPEMSRVSGTPEEIAAKLRARVNGALSRIAFFVVPSAAAFLCLGDVVGGAILQGGQFGAGTTRYLWYVLMGATVGLLAATFGRLYSSAFYSLQDTKTPLYFSSIRVALTAALAYFSVVQLPKLLGVPRELAVVGITGTTGIAAWIEYFLLRRALGKRIGHTGLPFAKLAKLWVAALLAAGVGIAVKLALAHVFGVYPEAVAAWGGHLLPAPKLRPLLAAPIILAPFGVAYFGITALLGVPEARELFRKVLRKAGRRPAAG